MGTDDLEELGPKGEAPEDPLERFRIWANPAAGTEHDVTLAGVLAQFSAAWDRRDDPNVVLLHYADMRADLPAEMRRLADALRIDVTDGRIEELASAASFEAMKSKAANLAPVATQDLWKDTSSFFRRGGGGEWRELLEDTDKKQYVASVTELMPSDLAAWSHTGRTGAGWS